MQKVCPRGACFVDGLDQISTKLASCRQAESKAVRCQLDIYRKKKTNKFDAPDKDGAKVGRISGLLDEVVDSVLDAERLVELDSHARECSVGVLVGRVSDEVWVHDGLVVALQAGELVGVDAPVQSAGCRDDNQPRSSGVESKRELTSLASGRA